MAQSQMPRKQSRDVRRAQLIEATLDCISSRGVGQTTMASVAAAAGLSHGLVNFHFESKEKLFLEVLLHLAGEYRAHWRAAIAAAPGDAPAQLHALIDADFRPPVCTPSRLAAWGAFWAEARFKPLYQQHCGANDQEYNDLVCALCQRMILEHGYQGDARRIGRVLRVMAEGVWLDMITRTESYGPQEARATVLTVVAALFPRHFTSEGLIASDE